jgi:Cytochrome c3
MAKDVRQAALAVAVLAASAFAAVPGLTPARALPSSPSRRAEADCLACHADEDLRSSIGSSVFVDPDVFSSSVHGQAGTGCTGCHADLAGVEDFPHALKLKPAVCAGCHVGEAKGSLPGVHRLQSPRLAAKPVVCKDCHGYHDILPLADERSALSAARRPATCAKCHPGAGANYSRGRVHDLAAAGRTSPARIVGALYKTLIGVMTVFFLAYVSLDLLRARRER